MSISIRGVDKLIKKLGKVAAIVILEPPMQRGVLRLKATMQHYPPAPARSSYVRTGTLGRRTTTRVTKSSGGLTGKVGNTTRYGPFVQSERFQMRIHQRTGWTTDRHAVEQNEAAITADFQRAIDRALAGE